MIQRLLFKHTENTLSALELSNATDAPTRKWPAASPPLLARDPGKQERSSKNHLRSYLEKTPGLLLNQAGQGLTEYLVLLLLIAVISIGAARTLGRTIQGKLQMAERHIEDVQLEKRD